MGCTLKAYSLTGGCPPGTGGVRGLEMDVHNKNAIYDAETLETNNHVISAYANKETDGITAFALSLKTIEQDIEIANAVENPIIDRATGTRFFEQSASITIHYSADQTRNDELIEFVDAITGQNVILIIEDNAGVKRFYGLKNGMKVTEGAGGQGQAFGDLNGMQLTLTGKEPLQAPLVEFGATPVDAVNNVGY